MKLLQKIRIINWHYFWDEEIDVKPIVFLTGLNGSGKSTLIDALQLVLLGDTAGKYFNKAAIDKSSRTLKGYLRGEISDTIDGGFKYLRNGRFTSYIALEYYDDVHEIYFTMGIVFDSFEDGSEEHHFFSIEDKMPENKFVQNNIPMDYKTLLNYLNDEYKGKFVFFDSNRQYQDFLKRRFGGLKDKYFSLLKKATSFIPIVDITTFITQYVCDPQANIELDALQGNILQYKRLENEAKVIEKRVQRLEEISKLADVFKQNQEEMKITSYVLERCLLEQSYEKLRQFNQQIVDSKNRIQEIENQLEEYKIETSELELKRTKLIQDRASNDTVRITQNLENEKNEIQNKIDAINRNVEAVKRTLLFYLDGYARVSAKLVNDLAKFTTDVVDDETFDTIQDVLKEATRVKDACGSFKDRIFGNLGSLTKLDLNDLRDALLNFKNIIGRFAVEVSRQIISLETEINSLEEQTRNVKSGTKNYDPRLVLIKGALESALYEKFNEEIKVEIYSDLIDIDDLSWRDALEGLLSAQKFNLFVAPKYYNAAYAILRDLLRDYDFYKTALVDEEKIIASEPVCMPGSLAEEINTIHAGAKAYTDFLIGKVYKAKDPIDARKSGNGITKECDLYRNFALSKLNPKLYKESFIGRGGAERFIKEKNKELKEAQEYCAIFKKLRELIEEANRLEVFTQSEIENIFLLLKDVGTLAGLHGNLDYIANELSSSGTHLTESLDNRIKDIGSDIESVQASRDKLLLEKGTLETEIRTIKKEKIVAEQEQIKNREDQMNSHFDPFLIDEKALPLFKKELETEGEVFKVFEKYNVLLSKINHTVSTIMGQLVRLRREYCQDYHLSYETELEDNKIYDDELVDFRDVKLPEYREKILDSYNKATKQFKDDFIFKLRGAIEDAEDQIFNLNEALKLSTFGKDSYRFTVKPSQVYRRYYDMLKDDLVINSQDDEEFVNKYKDVMDDLFRQIVDVGEGEKNSLLLDNIAKFTDYRSYLDFDLIVINRDTGDEQRLSRMIKKKSGGETQTPFYIAVLASFAQLYHTNEEGELGNTARLIIFDEAFSKMDKGRMTEAVKLLRTFNLQVILSAPHDKVPDISPLVDETLLVLHDKNKSCVRLFGKE